VSEPITFNPIQIDVREPGEPFGRATSPFPEPHAVMTSDQVVLVRSTWPMIADRSGELSARFYDRLFAIDDSAARLFIGVDMTAQRTKLVHTLVFVVEALDDVDRLLPAIAALGKRHTHYGVADRHFDSVGNALLLAFADTLGDAFSPELREAWAAAYAFLSSVMRRALMRGDASEDGRTDKPI